MPRLPPALRLIFALTLCLGLAMPGHANAAGAGRFIADHLAFDIAGAASWRAAWTDDRNPGFHLAGGGPELNVGLEFDNGIGFLIGGRALFLSHVGGDVSMTGLYIDASGHLMGQIRVTDWIRIGLGASGGRLWRCCNDAEDADLSALLFGGFLRLGIDVLPRNALPRALGLWMRVGIDGTAGAPLTTRLPQSSMNIAVGLGLRL